jgi:proline dehydrogenase
VTLLDRAIVRALPAVPRPVVRRLSERYIAGPDLADACRVTKRLNGQGKLATIDVLGEEVSSEREALALVAEYRNVFETLEREELAANISVKPTGLGLKLDRAFCRDNVATLVRWAEEHDTFVRIDMEDSTTTDLTLAVYRDLREEGLDNVGVVLQAALRRTVADAVALGDLRPSVRVCKGIYVEPPEIAYQDDDEIRRSFVETLEALLEAGAYVAIATHDRHLIEEGRRLVEEHGLGSNEYEFQMLLGVRTELGDELVAEGRRLRIYVPYGRRWYEYSIRRLQENPKLATHIAVDTLRRLKP